MPVSHVDNQPITPAELAAAMQACAENGDAEGLAALRALAKRLAEKKPQDDAAGS